MNPSWNWKKIAGWVLHVAVAGIMLLAGTPKVLGMFPAEEVAKLGLNVPIQVIGAGELLTAILLLIPRTSSLGVLLASGFWGGAISFHMAHGEPFVLQSAFLLVTWAGAAEAVAGAGCRLLYLPPYSPDKNPIENAYAKLKSGLRDWAARTVAGVMEGLRRLVGCFSPAECLHYFRHCGYVPATAN